MKKELVLQSVQNSVSSIFSKEDVINLINSIEGGGRVISVDDIERAIDKVIDSFERNTEEIVDYTSVEFNISYDNRLEVESIGLNLDYVREALENNFMDFGEAIEEDDVVELERAENEL
jgi:regulator of sigma D